MGKGILIGCDENQEWLLSWWWKNYKEENSLPCAFADFGMSKKGRGWCERRGLLLEIDTKGLKVAPRNEIDGSLLTEWEKAISPFWNSRGAWFKKPFALLASPFEETAWIDLDCEVLGPLNGIFAYIDPKSKMGLLKIKEDPPIYNSGVIVFQKGSPLLKVWADAAVQDNSLFLGDQDALSHVIRENGYTVADLPESYNWLMCRGAPLKAFVLHWAAEWGKAYIRKHGGLRGASGFLGGI